MNINREVKPRFAAFLLFFALLIPSIPSTAKATARSFTYAYESRVLPAGEVEFEPWITSRFGHTGFYHRLDQRLEFEVGLTERLQTSVYINTTAITEDTSTGRTTEYNFDGISSEWKFKLSDPVADPVGFALYLEGNLSSSEGEIEQRFIFDKEFGKFLGAFNIVSSYGWDFGVKPTGKIFEIELDASLAYPISEAFSLGIEMKNHNAFPSADTWAHSALFLGPVASYATTTWWSALTVLPQIAGLKGSTDSWLVLNDQERIEVRLVFGVDI